MQSHRKKDTRSTDIRDETHVISCDICLNTTYVEEFKDIRQFLLKWKSKEYNDEEYLKKIVKNNGFTGIFRRKYRD